MGILPDRACEIEDELSAARVDYRSRRNLRGDAFLVDLGRLPTVSSSRWNTVISSRSLGTMNSGVAVNAGREPVAEGSEVRRWSDCGAWL